MGTHDGGNPVNWLRRAYLRYWERQKAKALGVAVLVRAAQDKIGGLPTPPTHACAHRDAFLRFCGRPLFEEDSRCFWHCRDLNKYSAARMESYFGCKDTLKAAIEKEVKSGASLYGAYLENAALGGNWFERGADLTGADLRAATLRNAHLSYGCLAKANLTFASLEYASLSDVNLDACVLTKARLFCVKLRNNDFRTSVGLEQESFKARGYGVFSKCSILETYPDQAEPMYRSLMAYFVGNGAVDDASWAAYRYRLMHHRLLRAKLCLSRHTIEAATNEFVNPESEVDPRLIVETGVRNWLHTLGAYFKSCVYLVLCGYGEKPARVATVSAFAILAYAAAYARLHVLNENGFPTALYFSIVTFTTLGYGDLSPSPHFRLLAASEALAGLLLSGLFLFTLSRRSVGRS